MPTKPRIKIKEGDVFGNLTVICELDRVVKNNKPQRMFRMKCVCGNIVDIGMRNFYLSDMVSCGCRRCENGRNLVTHGLSKTTVHNTWERMRQRVRENASEKDRKRYYERGITICKEWESNYIAFHVWALDNGFKDGLELDRIDNDGNYEPSNCRFVTQLKNCNNRSTCIFFEYNGDKLTISEIARLNGLLPSTLQRRIRQHGMTLEEALVKTDYRSNKREKFKG